MSFTNNASGSRSGQINNSGADDALFLKIFAGEILAQYDVAVKTEGAFRTRNITQGKSAQFPITGIAEAKYHVPGQSLIEEDNGYLNKIGVAEKVINIDGLLVAPTFIHSYDEMRAHYDVRVPFAEALGHALAKKADYQRLLVALRGAREDSGYLAGSPGGSVLKAGPTVATDALTLAGQIYEAGTVLDEKNVPEDGRRCWLRPRMYDMLAQCKELYSSTAGNAAIYRDGEVLKINNISLTKTNLLPNTNVTVNPTGASNTYTGDFRDTVALVTTPDAVGMLKLLDLAFEKEYQIERQGTLMVAKLCVGNDFLRPECAVEISKAS